MQKGNVNGAIKILINNMSGGIIPLTGETLPLLELKHPDAMYLPNCVWRHWRTTNKKKQQ